MIKSEMVGSILTSTRYSRSLSSRVRFLQTARLFLDGRFRFIIPIVLLGILRSCGALWVYGKFVQDGVFQTR